MKGKFKVNELYKIRFYDHCVGEQNKMVCEVVGWLVKEDSEHIVITYWRVDTDDAQIKRDNIEPVCIIKSCIIRTRKLS